MPIMKENQIRIQVSQNIIVFSFDKSKVNCLLLTGLQNFLNQLLWSPDILEGPSLSKHSVDKLRQFLLMVLQKKLPTTFDDLPLEILNSLS